MSAVDVSTVLIYSHGSSAAYSANDKLDFIDSMCDKLDFIDSISVPTVVSNPRMPSKEAAAMMLKYNITSKVKRRIIND